MVDYPRLPPDPVSRPALVQRWDTLTFAHWPYPPDVIQHVLPRGLQVDTHEGQAWVGLVPFRMVRVRPPGVPVPPWITTFPETNVRTYVRGPDGGTGVWFSSLEITRLLGVMVARTVFRVPYTWASMDIVQRQRDVSYRSRRRWPSPRGAHANLHVALGGPSERTPLVDFLVNRWRAYTTSSNGSVIYAPVAHEPWDLYDAELSGLSQDLLDAAGLTPPRGSPLVHYSPGVSARVGLPRSAEPSRR